MIELQKCHSKNLEVNSQRTLKILNLLRSVIYSGSALIFANYEMAEIEVAKLALYANLDICAEL